MPPTEPVGQVKLNFDAEHLIVGDDADIRHGLSAVALHAERAWLACDEGCRLERLSQTAASSFADHRVFDLDTLLTLPAASTEEADIEGMDVDDGWLWLVGSHSVKRKKPKTDDSAQAVADKLARTSRDGNRHLLARIPLNGDSPQRQHGSRRAAVMRATAESSDLLEAIRPAEASRADRHLASFVDTAGKDNGLDIEGLAVRGMRAFVGLRGPVLREWCCVLELLLDASDERLLLRPVDGSVLYRKHFLKLNGLGVRDLVIHGDDLLILAGPAMAHDGPHEIWRWKRGARTGTTPAAADVTRLLTLPQREGADRAEGFTIFDESSGHTTVLVVYDTPVPKRLAGESGVFADLFRLG
jgi:hypothetical protein